MTRHTPDFLRQRSSNLSLRMAAATNAHESSSYSARATPVRSEKPEGLNKTQIAHIVGDLSKRSSYSLCDTCERDLGSVFFDSTEALKCRRASSSDQCDTCQIMSVNPEAFTQPFCAFLRDNPTIFHAIDYFKGKAKACGFEEVRD